VSADRIAEIKAASAPVLGDTETWDYRCAPKGEGPLAYEWSDKPHRLIYDLAGAVERLTAKLAKAKSELWEARHAIAGLRSATQRHQSMLAERDATIAKLAAERADVWDEGASSLGHVNPANPYRAALDAESTSGAAECTAPEHGWCTTQCGVSRCVPGTVATLDAEGQEPAAVYRTGIQCPTGEHQVGTVCDHPYRLAAEGAGGAT
jgi:hypothetical protein